jgi:hypothetical protein
VSYIPHFSLSVLCCCWVALQPQSLSCPPIFVRFVFRCCVVVESHSSHSFASHFADGLDSPLVFSFSCCRCPHQLQATVFRFF